MLIHIGNRKSLRTKCKKPVARRWWVDDARVRYGQHGPLKVYEEVHPEKFANCPDCLKGVKR